MAKLVDVRAIADHSLPWPWTSPPVDKGPLLVWPDYFVGVTRIFRARSGYHGVVVWLPWVVVWIPKA